MVDDRRVRHDHRIQRAGEFDGRRDELAGAQLKPRVIDPAHDGGRVLAGIDHVTDDFNTPVDRVGFRFRLESHLPRALFGTQCNQFGNVFLVNIRQHAHATEVRDPEQIDAGLNDLAQRDISFEHGPVQRRANLDVRPRFPNARALPTFTPTDAGRLGIHLGDFVVGLAPGSQGPFGALDGNHIRFVLLPRLADHLTRDTSLFQSFQPFERRLGRTPPRNGIDQIAFLLADLLAPDDGDQLPFAHEVPRAKLPHHGRVCHLCAVRIRCGDLPHFDDLTREPRMDDGQVTRIKEQRPRE